MKASGWFLLMLFLIITFSGWGQTTDLPEPQINNVPGNPPPPGLPLPLDDHIFLLFAAGIGLGIYMLLLSRRNSLSSKQ